MSFLAPISIWFGFPDFLSALICLLRSFLFCLDSLRFVISPVFLCVGFSFHCVVFPWNFWVSDGGLWPFCWFPVGEFFSSPFSEKFRLEMFFPTFCCLENWSFYVDSLSVKVDRSIWINWVLLGVPFRFYYIYVHIWKCSFPKAETLFRERKRWIDPS